MLTGGRGSADEEGGAHAPPSFRFRIGRVI